MRINKVREWWAKCFIIGSIEQPLNEVGERALRAPEQNLEAHLI
jgi:hypothetical protein